jgi:UDP-N-acetylmuramyl tripeptide synthase
MMGTITYQIGDQVREAEHTTPEAPEIQSFLREAMERSANCGHGSVITRDRFHRVDIEFAVAATNLTQDHLDYHVSMDEYYTVKRRFFDGSLGSMPATSVINVDDPRGADLMLVGGSGAMSYSLRGPADISTSSVARGLKD